MKVRALSDQSNYTYLKRGELEHLWGNKGQPIVIDLDVRTAVASAQRAALQPKLACTDQRQVLRHQNHDGQGWCMA